MFMEGSARQDLGEDLQASVWKSICREEFRGTFAMHGFRERFAMQGLASFPDHFLEQERIPELSKGQAEANDLSVAAAVVVHFIGVLALSRALRQKSYRVCREPCGFVKKVTGFCQEVGKVSSGIWRGQG